ncbi:NUDIX hydrolase [Streptomyces sp. BR1]|uniref:NUDIX hydrolase n=1 Tax=Streptomyces sp. BR1 TaxID=1592323 RepID=UPI00402B9BD7
MDDSGRYLLHLLDHKPGAIASSGMWSLLGGGRESGESPEAAIARELREEAGLVLPGLERFALSSRTGPDGASETVQVFTGRWSGDAHALPLTEGIMCHWFSVDLLDRLRVDPGTAAIIRHHAGHTAPDASTASVAEEAGPSPVAPSVERFAVPVDAHAALVRPGERGLDVLLTRRAGGGYASGLWHLPSGHLDGPHEDIVDALVREAAEETGVIIEHEDVRSAVVVHHRSPGGSSRIGYFGLATVWERTPYIREPHLCSEMAWYPLDALPDDMVAYCRAGLDALRQGRHFAVHFQQPGDPIAYDRQGTDRLKPLPEADPTHLAGLSAPGNRTSNPAP